jgi:hypothetical protein
MKCRLEDSAALSVKRLFAGEEPVADQFSKERCAGIPDELVLPGDQDFLNQIGVIDEIDPLVQDSERGDRSVFARCLLEEIDRAAERAVTQKAECSQAAGSGRISHS